MAVLKNPTRGLRHALASFVPNWLSNRPGLNVGYRILFTIALVFDTLVETMLQGLYAAMPGKGTPTALSYIGQGRGILQGPNEPNSSYATRLRAWLASWFNAASDEILCIMLQNFLCNANIVQGATVGGVIPSVTIFDRAGHWVTANNAGVTSSGTDTNWNWDSISNPERIGSWSDIWIIVNPDPFKTWEGVGKTGWVNPAPAIPMGGGSYANAQWQLGGPQGVGLGHQVSRAYVNGMLSIISTWKGAHIFVVNVIWTNVASPLLFSPGNLTATGNPDGTWGKWGVRNSGTGVYQASRTRELTIGGVYQGHVRYWTPNGGD